jgi:hypothetical protein
MKIVYFILFFVSLLLIINISEEIITNKNNIENKDLGALLLTPQEATPIQIREIRNAGYEGLIYVPETKEIYGETKQLEKEGNLIKEIVGGWNNE